MSKKKIALIIIALVVVFSVVYNVFLKEKKVDLTIVEVTRGNVILEVSETGQVQMGKAINLGFKNSGIIQSLFVKVGDEVWSGTALAKLETTQLAIEKAESQAALDIAKAKLNQLLEGATAEEIQAARTDVQNAQVALDDAKQEYEDDLSQAYEDALNTLDNAYLKASGAFNTVTSLRKTYFSGGDQESITVKSEENDISSQAAAIKQAVDLAQASPTNENIGNALSATKSSLNVVYNDLNAVRDMTETINYTSVVSATDKTSLNTERTNINTASTNVVNAQQTIASARIDGQAAVNTAEGDLEEAQDDLALKLAKPSQANIDLYEAQVAQAQADVDLYDNQIAEATLRSPVQGRVTKINKRVGETWQPSLTESIVTILPAMPYDIEVDIYEEDIVKMAVGNDVGISLIAFPDSVFAGKVVAIEPAEKLIESVVYYTVTVSFNDIPEGVKPGMTADLAIRVASQENVLIVPENAIREEDGKKVVKVWKDDQTEEREIEAGLKGSDDMVEIISGLTEGEKVIVD